MIAIEEFTRLLEEEFEDITPGTLTPQTNYREIPNFSSMHALIIIAFIDNQFEVLLKGQDLKETQTVADLYRVVTERVA